MDDRELFKKVLSFLQQTIAYSNEEMARLNELKQLVRDRLAQPEEEQTRSEKLLEAGYTRRPKGWSKDDPKPVAWREIMGKWQTHYYDYNDDGRGEPLYTAPPKREWVGLTDEEIDAAVKSCSTVDTYKYFRAIEAKLKERNG